MKEVRAARRLAAGASVCTAAPSARRPPTACPPPRRSGGRQAQRAGSARWAQHRLTPPAGPDGRGACGDERRGRGGAGQGVLLRPSRGRPLPPPLAHQHQPTHPPTQQVTVFTLRHGVVRVEDTEDDLYAAIDLVTDKLKRKLAKVCVRKVVVVVGGWPRMERARGARVGEGESACGVAGGRADGRGRRRGGRGGGGCASAPAPTLACPPPPPPPLPPPAAGSSRRRLCSAATGLGGGAPRGARTWRTACPPTPTRWWTPCPLIRWQQRPRQSSSGVFVGVGVCVWGGEVAASGEREQARGRPPLRLSPPTPHTPPVPPTTPRHPPTQPPHSPCHPPTHPAHPHCPPVHHPTLPPPPYPPMQGEVPDDGAHARGGGAGAD